MSVHMSIHLVAHMPVHAFIDTCMHLPICMFLYRYEAEHVAWLMRMVLLVMGVVAVLAEVVAMLFVLRRELLYLQVV